MWVGHVQCENSYKTIDNFFSNNIVDLENKLKSKNSIFECITKKVEEKKTNALNVPISEMVNVANKTISNYIDTLSESDQKELKSLLSSNDETIKESYLMLKGSVIGKLEKLEENEQDKEVIGRINETIETIKNETFDKMRYFKLRKLNENL
jgi:hypothetical protein